jgi:hypothetical protein
MSGVDSQRRKDRENALFKNGVEIGAVVIVEFFVTREHNADTSERRNKFVEENALGLSDKGRELLMNFAQLLRSGPTIGCLLTQSSGNLIFQASDTNLKELIEVLRKDCNELGPFKKGNIGIRGKSENSGVEVEP